jgi:hypothetical protein
VKALGRGKLGGGDGDRLAMAWWEVGVEGK